MLPNLTLTVCEKINQRLNITSMPVDTGGGYSTSKFQGSFSDNTEIVLGAPQTTACFQRGSDYHFYTVLIER